MKPRINCPYILVSVFCLLIIFNPIAESQEIIADHACISQFNLIPQTVIDDISADFQFVYGHTSHGSQIITGLDMIESENSALVRPYFNEFSDDLGTTGDTSWVDTFRWRIQNTGYKYAMMSWCGGVSTNTPEGINTYLDKLNELEADYPDVTFIYMTGHLDGSGTDGNLYAMNDLIRSYCMQNDKILFDFADIESFDPDGTFYPDESDACNWCYDWCSTHDCPTCGSCAHSHCFNCYQKGKAFWWLIARIDGWSPDIEPPGCGDCTGDNLVNVLDIIYLIEYKFQDGPPPDPMSTGDVDMNQQVNVLDIIFLINYKYKNGPAPTCMK